MPFCSSFHALSDDMTLNILCVFFADFTIMLILQLWFCVSGAAVILGKGAGRQSRLVCACVCLRRPFCVVMVTLSPPGLDGRAEWGREAEDGRTSLHIHMHTSFAH